MGLNLSSQAQSAAYTLDLNYNGKGYSFAPTWPASNDDGYATAIHLNDDGSEYVALTQLGIGDPYSVAALLKRKPNGTRDSTFATNGLATNGAMQGVDINTISLLSGNKIYCSGSGWGGFVWRNGVWSSQTYYGYVMTPAVGSYDATKLNDSTVVQVGEQSYINIFRDNGNTTGNTYANSGSSGSLTYSINGNTYSPEYNKIEAVSNSNTFFVAGVVDTIAFIAKHSASGFGLVNSWGNNGIMSFNVFDFSDDRFLDMVIQPDGKVLALYAGQPQGTNNSDRFLYRFNTDGTIDNTFGINGKISNLGAFRIALLPNNEIALLSTYNFNVYETGITLYTATGEFIQNFQYPVETESGYQHLVTPTGISVNAVGDIAICGSIRDSATAYDKPVTIRLKRTECTLTGSVNVTSTNSAVVNFSGVSAYPVEVIVGQEGGELIVVESGNSAEYTNLSVGNGWGYSITDANGCTVIGTFNITEDADVEESLLKNISVYPNPGKGMFYIYGYNAGDLIKVFSQTGQPMYAPVYEGMLDLTNYAAGVYYINYTSTANGTAKVMKIVKN